MIDQKGEDTKGSNDNKLQVIKEAEKVLRKLPEAEQEIVRVAFSSFYSGPIMPPELLKDLESIIPGGANRVLQLTEKEQAHRHKMEAGEQAVHVWQAQYSLIGGIISFALLVSGIIYCAANGFNWGTGSLAGIGAFGVISHIIRIPLKDKK